MAGEFDANLKLLYAADPGSFFTADTVKSGEAFDVIANVEIGEDLNEVVDQHDVFVAVRNLNQSSIVASQTFTEKLTPQDDTPHNQEIRIAFSSPWNTNEGDVLEVIATYKVTGGIHTDYSSARSAPVIVTA